MSELQFPDGDPSPDDVAVEADAEAQADEMRSRFGAVRNLRRHAARGMIVNSAYQVGIAGLTALRGLGAAALLTTVEYGIWGLLGLSMFTVIALKVIGVNQKYVQQSDPDQELAFQKGFTIELIFSAISMPVIAAIVVGISLVTGHEEVIAPGLLLTLLVPGLAMQFPVWAYYRRMDFKRQRSLQIVDPVVATVVTIVLAATGAGYWSLVIGAVAGAISGGGIALFASPHPLRWRYDRGTLRQYVGFSGPMAISAIAVLATFYAIYLTGNEAIGLAGLGAFTMVGNLLRFTEKADGVITDTLYPALCAVQDKTQVLFEAFVKSNRLALMWAAPFGIGLSLFASDLIFHVLGDQWVGAIELLQIVGVITAVHHVGFNWSAFYRARGDTVPTAVSAVVGAVATIAAGVPLMFAFGITGLGWGYAVAELVGFLVRAIYIRRLFAGFNPIVHLLRALWPTAVGAAVVLAMRATGATVSGADGALLELAVFLGTIAVATWAFERRLLGEAIGYFSGRARPAATSESAPEPVG